MNPYAVRGTGRDGLSSSGGFGVLLGSFGVLWRAVEATPTARAGLIERLLAGFTDRGVRDAWGDA
ncbi:hypothetical protein [Streptomyces sp. NPDC055189]